MKVFRLAKAELYKLMQRPALYIITGLLVLALAIFAVFYTPQNSSSVLSSYSGTMTEINTQFEEKKSNFDKKLNDKIKEIEEKHYKITNSTPKLKEIQNKFENVVAKQNSLNSAVIALSSSDNLTNAKSALTALKTQVLETRNSLSTLNNEIDFYLTKDEFNDYYEYLDRYYKEIPTEAQLSNYNKTAIINLSNSLFTNFDINQKSKFITSLKAFELDTTQATSNLEKFGYSVQFTQTDNSTILNELYKEIKAYYQENITSEEQNVKAQFIEKLKLYESLSIAGQKALDYSFTLALTNGLTDDYINSLIGFENINTYSLKENVLTYSFELENKLSQDSYTKSPAFFSASNNPTAYDFTISAMRILSIIIIIACVFFSAGMIAGESSQGTLKMLAIRPYSRNKLLLGKFIACLEFMLILLGISTLATFIVGGCLFGFGSPNVLLIFNASSLTLVHPICLILIYLATLILETTFFIIISLLLSTLFRSGTIAVVSSFIFYLATLIINLFAGTQTWAKFLPSTHSNLYGFFGGMSNSVGPFGFFVPADANFFVSFSIIVVLNLLFLALNLVIFRKKEIS